jgi:hypothetical protein
MDASWASARDWSDRTERVGVLLDEAGRAGAAGGARGADRPACWRARVPIGQCVVARLPSIVPAPFAPDYGAATEWVAGLDQGAEVFWVSDGLAHAGRDALLGALSDLGPVAVFQGGRDVIGLSPPRFEDGTIQTDVRRHMAPAPRELTIVAHGLDPAGIPRDLARQTVALDTGDMAGTAVFDLPPELRNRITRFEVAGVRSAGAVTLTDDALQRREVALIDAQGDDEGQALLSPLHYLRQALAPTADLMEGALSDMLLASPDALSLRISPRSRQTRNRR